MVKEGQSRGSKRYLASEMDYFIKPEKKQDSGHAKKKKKKLLKYPRTTKH